MKNKTITQQIKLGILLILLSALCYLVHYLLFHDSHHIFVYLVGDIAFVFIEVLMVTLIIHQVLSQREKLSMLKKLNMVIGAFFSEVGTELIRHFIDFEESPETLTNQLNIDARWTDDKFDTVAEILKKRQYNIDASKAELSELRDFLVTKKQFMLRLLENPNLLEHESFTDTLWGIFHLAEELEHRENINALPENDILHLNGDIKRAYSRLTTQWLDHMEHLKIDYPYLFSLAARTNPFNPKASAVVE